ncbi:hypothetical protein, unknown function [Leishmania tarentolae]|uniref:C3H1-type domain-containing protein n=1 Tax=Leishmania tarentolae TaxID=5689 RepID=A0A640KPD3_LEITA|nr:hypothetical protein, unknown function [Leishmania tarentolae]
MGEQAMMDELPNTARLSSELRDAFSEYLERGGPHPGPFSWNEAAELLSAFTGTSVYHISAALGVATKREKITVSKDDLHSFLEELMRIDGFIDAWWDSPGVTMPVLTSAVDQEASEGSSSTRHCGWESLTSVHALSHPPLPLGSTSTEEPHVSKMDAGSGKPSLHPTLNSWGRRGSKRSGTCSVPSLSSDRPHNTAASMDCVVATALGELELYVDEEQCSIQFNPELGSLRFPSEMSTETERFGVAAAQRQRSWDRFYSPSPLHSADKQTTRPQCLPAAPTSTLAELDCLVQRGKTAKVCKQFMQTGRCTFGARCLYHHPSAGAAAPEGPYIVPQHLS